MVGKKWKERKIRLLFVHVLSVEVQGWEMGFGTVADDDAMMRKNCIEIENGDENWGWGCLDINMAENWDLWGKM